MAEKKRTQRKPAAKKPASNKRKTTGTRKRTTRKKNTPIFESKQALILGGVLLVALAVFGGLFLGMKAATGDETPSASQEVQPSEQPDEEVAQTDYADIDKALKLAMFNLGIPKESITERSVMPGAENTVFYTMKLDKAEQEKLVEAASESFEKLGLKSSEEEGGLMAGNGEISVTLVFPEEKRVEKPVEKPEAVEKKPELGDDAPKMALLIDDCGYNLGLAKKLASLQYPVTMAVLPHLPYDRETADLARSGGKTVFLHMPMEPLSYPDTDPGKGALLLNMPPTLIEAQVKRNVESLGMIDGFNNHMGSAFTENGKKMQQVLTFMKSYTDTFVDSYTSPRSVAYETCVAAGYKCGHNRKFLDNKADAEYIKSKLRESADYAKKHGSVIAIGHLRDSTVDVLSTYLSEIERSGVKIVSVKELVGG
ncbi:divergent polysaccharide deacetylase family protein [Limisalsivibrio acetivorans]|uniref:divergent polysaccharide deacetylase family protein n=1 Tax=Limisalsivibrio acetivorans TaxID=1304888 RepID=UPI0003B4736E|nr:divergent polysaccharide deacetylase family protein [Limisalsivibrio acetivorans]